MGAMTRGNIGGANGRSKTRINFKRDKAKEDFGIKLSPMRAFTRCRSQLKSFKIPGLNKKNERLVSKSEREICSTRIKTKVLHLLEPTLRC